LETLQRRNKRHDLAELERVIREYAVREIVVGLPLRMSGAEAEKRALDLIAKVGLSSWGQL